MVFWLVFFVVVGVFLLGCSSYWGGVVCFSFFVYPFLVVVSSFLVAFVSSVLFSSFLFFLF